METVLLVGVEGGECRGRFLAVVILLVVAESPSPLVAICRWPAISLLYVTSAAFGPEWRRGRRDGSCCAVQEEEAAAAVVAVRPVSPTCCCLSDVGLPKVAKLLNVQLNFRNIK